MLFINDLGIVNALGTGKSQVRDNLLGAAQRRLETYTGLLSGRVCEVARVKEPPVSLPAGFEALDCRNNRMLSLALEEIRPGVAALLERLAPERVAVIMGTSTSGIASGEMARRHMAEHGRLPESFHYRQQEIGSTAAFAARYLGLTGPCYNVSTACSSSAKALLSAERLIAAGFAEAAIVGGADTLCELTLNGFDALESLAPQRCNPCSVNRNGITLGEGASACILSKYPGEIALLGCGESSDGHHISAPDPHGAGAEIAIRKALQAAQVDPQGIGYINLHGTATRLNDAMEAAVVHRIFGPDVVCSSTKPELGHTLGAAGGQEVGLCWLLLESGNGKQRLPKHQWDGERDPALCPIRLAESGDTWTNGKFLSNSFAFGGSNAAVIIGRA